MVLFIAWGVLSILWVYDAIYKLAHGEPGPAIAAVVALLLMLVLAVMEGLEVVMIHDWNQLYPDRTAHDLAAWLAARQMFVALIVTRGRDARRASLDRDPIHLDGDHGSGHPQDLQRDLDDLTILWFMQILPKHMAAINPDRYLKVTGGAALPVVNLVKAIGISWPAEKTAGAVQKLLGWHAEPTLEGAPRRGADLADAWAALTPDDGRAAQRPPEQ